jgi:alkylhydroperoxidase family enzyme
VIADVRGVAMRWPDERPRMLAEIASVVTEVPWALSPDHHVRARDAGLSDDELLHAIALSSFFGHLNRIADAVGVALDYEVRHRPPHAEPATPPLHRAPARIRGTPVLAIDARPATAAALAAWRDYVVARSPVSHQIAAWVAELLGDGDGDGDGDPVPGDESELRRLVEQVTLAPWRLGDDSFAPLRGTGYDDAALFDACAAASAFGVFSRIRVALTALGG